MEREFSAGGIVFRNKGRGVEILLIKDAYGHWSWPKGNIEPKESSQDTALREIKEEVGLANLRILGKVGRSNYFYRLKGELVFKTVYFFLIKTEGKERLKPQQDEIKTARWFKPQEAGENLDYKGAKQMLTKAIKMYTGRKDV